MRAASGFLLALLVAASSAAGVREVELSLPIRAKLALTGHEKVYIGPFIREVQEDRMEARLAFSVEAEFERELRRLLRKESRLVLLPAIEGVEPPTLDPLLLPASTNFWRELGAQSGADYIIAGSIDFEIEDRSGYQTEEYVSPVDGRTYYRQAMVEQTGFSYDILLQVFDGRTGEVVHEQPMKDFREQPERNFDEFTGMFANLYALENQIIGIFVPRTVKSKRVLFTP